MTDELTTLREIFPGYHSEIVSRLSGDTELRSIMDDLLECHYIVVSDNFQKKSKDLKGHYRELYEDLRQELLEYIDK